MRQRDRIALILVASVLVVAPFALGGAPRWAICITSLLSAGAAASFVLSRREMATLSPLLAFVSLAALLTLLQVVPLPSVLVELMSPGKHQLVVENARALGESPPGWTPLSLDPPATLLELAKLCGYVAFAYAALRVASSDSRRQWLLMAVAGIGAAMAATALIHVAIGAETLFGIYRPREALVRPTLAPLLNHNHLSAFMAFSAPIALGLAVASTARARLGWLAVTTLCAGVGLLAESRGGAIALVIGLVTAGAFMLLQRRSTHHKSRLKPSDMVAIAVVAMSALVLLGLLTAGGVARDLSGTRMGEVSQAGSRFAVWRESSSILSEYRATGVGRGAFEMVTTRVHDSSAVTFPRVENEYLQAVLDWGFVGAAALALVMIWLATVAARNARTSPWEAGAFAGLVALAVENLTDFSLWMPGVAYPAIAVLAVLTWSPVAVTTVGTRVLAPVRVAALVPIAAVVALTISPLGRQTSEDTAILTHDLSAHPDARANHADAAAVWARHPSSYAAAGLVARSLFVARDRRAIAVANRALALHPTSSELHRLIAQMLLASQQRAQARTEYALALRYRFRPELLTEVIAAFPNDADLVRALPLDRLLMTELAGRLAELGRVPASQAYLQRYLTFHPEDTRVLMYTANLALNVGDAKLAVDTARRAYQVDPSSEVTIVLARSLTKDARSADALSLLQSALDRGRLQASARLDVLVALAETQMDDEQHDAARQNFHAALALTSGRQAATIHRKLADLEERTGNRHQSDWERHRAEELER